MADETLARQYLRKAQDTDDLLSTLTRELDDLRERIKAAKDKHGITDMEVRAREIKAQIAETALNTIRASKNFQLELEPQNGITEIELSAGGRSATLDGESHRKIGERLAALGTAGEGAERNQGQ